MQWLLWAAAANKDRPWTFDEFCRSEFPRAYEPGKVMRKSFKRSLRRSLLRLVELGKIIPLGIGGRAEPTRYCINPSSITNDDEFVAKIMEHLKPYGFEMKENGRLWLRGHH